MWDEPLCHQQNGPIIGYSVQVMKANSADSIEDFTHVNYTTITDLVPYTNYEWRVAGQTVAGIGPFSGTVTQQTLPCGI